MTPMWFQAHGARLPDLESLPVDFSLSTRGRAELAGPEMIGARYPVPEGISIHFHVIFAIICITLP